MAKEATNLVIVESPSKAKTIGKYLGPDYLVKASMGHLRDLPKSKFGIDLDHDFTPIYQPMKGKEAIIKELTQLSKGASMIYLATDPDREGEAISWHLKELLQLPDDKSCRVTFNEITQKVVPPVHRGIPGRLTMRSGGRAAGAADAGPDRRLSAQPASVEKDPPGPVCRARAVRGDAAWLWTGRRRSVRSSPQEYWTLDAQFTRIGKPGTFVGQLSRRRIRSGSCIQEQEVQQIIDDVQGKPFTVQSVKRTEKKRTPPAAVYHLDPPAGGVAEAEYDAKAGHGCGPAAVRRRRCGRMSAPSA